MTPGRSRSAGAPVARAPVARALRAGALLAGVLAAGCGAGPVAAPAPIGPAASSAASAGTSAGTAGSSAGSATVTVAGAGRTLDLQAHRGGAGERSESTLGAFEHALQVGVTTLELDTHITEDRKVVVIHDNAVNPGLCTDTTAATPGDAEFPYAGDLVKDLSLAQLSTLDCSGPNPDLPDQLAVKNGRIVELSTVFDLVERAGADDVRFNIEIKIDGDKLEESVPREEFASLLQHQIQAAGMADRVTIQSFDWPSLQVMHGIDAALPLVALTARVDVAQLPTVTAISGVTTLSPRFDSVTPELVTAAHGAGLLVIPWTVDTDADMQRMIDLGVDGIISNYPTRLRQVLQNNGIPVPTPVTG